MARSLVASLFVLAGLLQACGTAGSDYFWVETLPAPTKDDPAFVISRGDVISVRVYGQDALSARAKVREDGKVTVPFVNDIVAADFEPSDLARRIQIRLKDYIVNPVVTVTIEEVGPVEVSVVGEVVRPGIYQLDRSAGVLKAIAAAGGMTPFAHRDQIFVLRQRHWADSPRRSARIRFSFDKLIHGEGRGASFTMRSGDTVVVE